MPFIHRKDLVADYDLGQGDGIAGITGIIYHENFKLAGIRNSSRRGPVCREEVAFAYIAHDKDHLSIELNAFMRFQFWEGHLVVLGGIGEMVEVHHIPGAFEVAIAIFYIEIKIVFLQLFRDIRGGGGFEGQDRLGATVFILFTAQHCQHDCGESEEFLHMTNVH